MEVESYSGKSGVTGSVAGYKGNVRLVWTGEGKMMREEGTQGGGMFRSDIAIWVGPLTLVPHLVMSLELGEGEGGKEGEVKVLLDYVSREDLQYTTGNNHLTDYFAGPAREVSGQGRKGGRDRREERKGRRHGRKNVEYVFLSCWTKQTSFSPLQHFFFPFPLHPPVLISPSLFTGNRSSRHRPLDPLSGRASVLLLPRPRLSLRCVSLPPCLPRWDNQGRRVDGGPRLPLVGLVREREGGRPDEEGIAAFEGQRSAADVGRGHGRGAGSVCGREGGREGLGEAGGDCDEWPAAGGVRGGVQLRRGREGGRRGGEADGDEEAKNEMNGIYENLMGMAHLARSKRREGRRKRGREEERRVESRAARGVRERP